MQLSVICPVFDADPIWLLAAAASAMDQCATSGIAAELILIDDGSVRAETVEALRELEQASGAVRVIRPGRNSGPASARNHGLAAACGEWVGFLDADDLWLPGRLTAQGSLMTRRDVAWIGGRHRLLLADGSQRTAAGIAEALGRPSPGIFKGPDLTNCLIANFWMHLGAMLVRRDLARRIGGFAEGLFYAEDVLFMTRLSAIAPLHLVEAELYAWRRAGGGLTGAVNRLAPSSLRMHSLARADPLLCGFRRELRWARYSALKGAALNNLLAGRRGMALRLAFAAWRTDPRELVDFALFVALTARGSAAFGAPGRRYSATERVVLEDTK